MRRDAPALLSHCTAAAHGVGRSFTQAHRSDLCPLRHACCREVLMSGSGAHTLSARSSCKPPFSR